MLEQQPLQLLSYSEKMKLTEDNLIEIKNPLTSISRQKPLALGWSRLIYLHYSVTFPLAPLLLGVVEGRGGSGILGGTLSDVGGCRNVLRGFPDCEAPSEGL